MKRFELIVGVVIVVLVLAAIIAFFSIPRPIPKGRAGPGSTGSTAPLQDPARQQLWKTDPARTVYVFGEAVKAGAQAMPAEGAWTIRDLMSAAGGFKPEAVGKVRVLRKVNGAMTQVIDLTREQLETASDAIEPGDVVYVD